jgi:hypothetical protein
MRTYLMLRFVPSVAAAALLAAACQDSRPLTSVARKPNFWAGPPPNCPAGKWTGGGRIDPPSNYDAVDEPSGGQPPRYSDGLAPMNGKVTFGFNVFLAEDGSGHCFVQKGEIQVNHHPAKVAWHVSIHNGVDDFDNATVSAAVFPDNSGRGFCVVVGLPESFMTARVNGNRGFEKVQFEACDNDRGERQNSRTDAMRWRAAGSASGDAGDTGLTYLTGGNIVEHGS